ncbi:MAG: GGDEF domain-containing protein [Candidatus Obscuribacterales bacterium]|nr:GGDEF domain-containing protein [Candidatus Obscuribacterales bacterium]
MSGAINLSEENDLNYTNFLERLNLELERSKRYNRSFSICMFSLGGGGAEILAADVKPFIRELSRLICDVARIPDIVVSSSSEELALIMPETPIPGAFTAADRIRRRLSEQPISVDGKEVKLTVSMGVAAYPDHAGDPQSLAKVAKDAMELARTREANSIVSAAELSEQ